MTLNKQRLEQWAERVFRCNWVAPPFNWSGEKAWHNSVQHRWTHSSEENHGSAQASRYGTWKVLIEIWFCCLTDKEKKLYFCCKVHRWVILNLYEYFLWVTWQIGSQNAVMFHSSPVAYRDFCTVWLWAVRVRSVTRVGSLDVPRKRPVF